MLRAQGVTCGDAYESIDDAIAHCVAAVSGAHEQLLSLSRALALMCCLCLEQSWARSTACWASARAPTSPPSWPRTSLPTVRLLYMRLAQPFRAHACSFLGEQAPRRPTRASRCSSAARSSAGRRSCRNCSRSSALARMMTHSLRHAWRRYCACPASTCSARRTRSSPRCAVMTWQLRSVMYVCSK